MEKKAVVISIPGLSMEHIESGSMPFLRKMADEGRYAAMSGVFPALTLPVHANLTTGAYPEAHGVVANGFFSREAYTASFWEQPSYLVGAERVWDRIKKWNPNFKTASLFLQNTLYAGLDGVITPKPLHTEDGLIQWCYSKPAGLYEEISSKIGPFNLFSYWGPFASIESSRWIASASIQVFECVAPDLTFIYLPHLDYFMQRRGPEDPGAATELAMLDDEIGKIAISLDESCSLIVLSEYSFTSVNGDIPLNRLLRERGLLEVREICGREYVDIESSPVFAMADHQIAHLYIKHGFEKKAREAAEKMDGVEAILGQDEMKRFHVAHERTGELMLVSTQDKWFSYYWWDDPQKAPDFAGRIDIHRKPGYDPLELFLDRETKRVPQDTSLIKGSHGRDTQSLPLIVTGTAAGYIPDSPSINDIASVLEKYFSGE